MPKLKDQQDANAQYDPYSNETARDLIRQEEETGQNAGINAGIDQAESFANDPKNASKNIDDTRDREDAGNPFGYQQTDSPGPQKFDFKAFVRKKGPIGGVIALLLGGLGGLTMLISPGLAVVQLKEILTDDLNDQLSAMDLRTTHVMKAKLKDMGTGVCGPGAIKVRCGFKGMSDRQVKKFIKAGFKVETNGKTTFGFHKVKSLSITDSAGNTIRMSNPREVNRLLGDRLVRNAVRKAFNPKFAGFYDAVKDKVFGRLKTNSQDKLGSGTDEDKDKAVTSAVEGEPLSVDANGNPATEGDSDGDGVPDAEDSENDNQKAIESKERVSSGGQPTKSLFASVAKNGVKSSVKGLMITGALDSACSVKTAARAVEAGAKLYRQRQLIGYAMVFMTFADQVKAGTATADQAEYVGNKLTAIDTDKLIVDETSTMSGEAGTAKPVENPDYGKNAFDSNGYKAAMYNDAPTLSARDMQFTIGGGALMGSLSSINKYVTKVVGNKSCKVVQNWLFRGASLFAGAALGLISFGTSLYVSIGASVAIGMAVPILENYLAQMVAGTVVDGSTKGVDSGNAIFGGAAGLMGTMAMARGMKPANKSDLKKYLSLTEETKQEYIALETQEAKKTPFDIMNRYSFVGTIARSLLPLRTTSSVSVGNSFMNTLGSLSSVISILSPKAFAKNEYNEERFSKCKDYGYEEVGIDADIFCNVRYTMSPYELTLDTDGVRDWMFSNNQVTEDGAPEEGSDYEDWVKKCTEREIGWGETDDSTDNGKNCLKTDKKSSYFRVYTMDQSIIEAMEYTPPPPIEQEGIDIGNFTIASFNVLGYSHSKSDYKTRMDRSVSVLKKNVVGVAGLQEFQSQQRSYFNSITNNAYGMYPENADYNGHASENSIIWDNSKFSFVEGGTIPDLKYFGGSSHRRRSGLFCGLRRSGHGYSIHRIQPQMQLLI